MIVIPNDLSGEGYPLPVAQLLRELKYNRIDEEMKDDFYDSSVIFGCDCGCGGDSYFDSVYQIWEDRKCILKELHDLGYKVEGEDYDGFESGGDW